MMQYIKNLVFFALSISVFHCIAMNQPNSSKQSIYVASSDGAIISIERWKVQEIKVLLVLLEHQKGLNSRNNPLQAPLASEELNLLSNALTAFLKGKFETFCDEMIQKEGTQFLTDTQKRNAELDKKLLFKEQKNASLSKGILRTFINLAERMDTPIVTAFCLQYVLPSDVQHAKITSILVDNIKELIPVHSQFLVGHPNGVDAAVFSSDSTKLISYENNVALWNLIKLDCKVLKGHPPLAGINTVTFSPDGKTIVSCCDGGEKNLIMWNPQKLQPQYLIGHDRSVRDVIFSPDGTHMASAGTGNGKNIVIWDMTTKTPKIEKTFDGNPAGVSKILFSHDGTKLISAGWQDHDNLIVWDIATGKSQSLNGHVGSVSAIALSPDDNILISSSVEDQNNIIMWDMKTGKGTFLPGYLGVIDVVKFSPDGITIMFVGSGHDNNLTISDAATGKQKRVFVGDFKGTKTAVFNGDGSKIISAGVNSSGQYGVILWDVATGSSRNLCVCSSYINYVGLSPDKRHIIVCCSGEKNNLILISLLSMQEEEALSKCTLVQAQFLYRLFLALEYDLDIKIEAPFEKSIFDSLPQILQEMVYNRISVQKEAAYKKSKWDWINPFSKKK